MFTKVSSLQHTESERTDRNRQRLHALQKKLDLYKSSLEYTQRLMDSMKRDSKSTFTEEVDQLHKVV